MIWWFIVHVVKCDSHLMVVQVYFNNKSRNIFFFKLPTVSILKTLRDFYRLMIQDTAQFTVCVHFNEHQQLTRGVTRSPMSICSSLFQLLQHLQAIDLLSPLTLLLLLFFFLKLVIGDNLDDLTAL